MGDYTKVIINCSIKKLEPEKVEPYKRDFLDKVWLNSSPYHCGGELFEISNEWDYRSDITFVTQLKYSRGLEEFIKWLKPQVIEGMGQSGVFGMSFTEYQDGPTLYNVDPEIEE